MSITTYHNKLARILRTQPEALLDLERKMEKITGRSGVMEKIVEENEILIKQILGELGLPENIRNAKDIYDILIKRIKEIDEHLCGFLGKPDLSKMSGQCGKLCDVALSLSKGTAGTTGFFIKKERTAGMLEKFPPQNMLSFFGYKTASELVEKKGLSSVFSALRFVESNEWMHKFFDEAYNDLTAGDFEEREVELKVLEPEWLDIAEKFLEKKHHNLSHLKELGIIFIVPIKVDMPGETLRMFTLILHYLNEVPFYSKLFKKFSAEPDFAQKLKSLLRGDIPEGPRPDDRSFRIVQRYLAKDDPDDFRLVEPHVNPEAEHWYRAEGDLAKLPLEGFNDWQELDFAGDFFADGQNGAAGEDLVSFDLIDLTMSLVKKGEVKYLYHQQEALWNKIFIEYLGRDKMNGLVEENIIGGFIDLNLP